MFKFCVKGENLYMKQTKQCAKHKYCELCHRMNESNFDRLSTNYQIDFLFDLADREIYQKTRYVYYINFLS